MKSEEIINTLFENVKDVDESLDIDLSICATIPVTSNNCSNLPSDFWALESSVDLLTKPISHKIDTFAKIKQENLDINKVQEKIENLKKSYAKFKYKCEECAVIYLNLNELCMVNHESNHSVTLICDECDKEFENENDIKKHIKTHKNVLRRSAFMECPDCGKCLKLGSMWMHRKIHNNTKQYDCDICGQKFIQKINLTHHLKLHSAEKPFECPECQKTFPERSHMIRHQKYHSDQRPHKCEKCGKMYKTERCLKVHSLVHLDQRPFVCNVCNKSFLSNSKLKQHSNIHTGLRPYKCNYCSRDFTNFPNWLKHTRRRHNVDHKTGEILQNLPQYCSKQKKNSAAVKNLNIPSISDESKIKLKQELIDEHETDKLFSKDIQHIKVENKNSSIDLHCLSITSAEDLIMEQALEMEEAGFFKNKNYVDEIPKKIDFINREIRLYGALSAIDSSALSSPASDFQTYMPLPPITTMTSNNFFISTATISNSNNSQQILPSMNTFFPTECQKAYSNI